MILDVARGDKITRWFQKVVEDTNANATVICYDILHKECTYSLDAYNPYV